MWMSHLNGWTLGKADCPPVMWMGPIQSTEPLRKILTSPKAKRILPANNLQTQAITSTLSSVSRLSAPPSDFGCIGYHNHMSQCLKINISSPPTPAPPHLSLSPWRTLTTTVWHQHREWVAGWGKKDLRKGRPAGSVRGAWGSWSPGHEFEPHLGCGDCLSK